MDVNERDKNMLEEAISRMKILKLYDEPEDSIIVKFEKEGTVFLSTPAMNNRVGVIYQLSPAEKKIVDDFEEETGCLAYHVIRNHTEFGLLYSILYVSQENDEWDMDHDDLDSIQKTGTAYPVAYVYNAGMSSETDDDLSGGDGEFGSIGIISGAGGLCRTE